MRLLCAHPYWARSLLGRENGISPFCFFLGSILENIEYCWFDGIPAKDLPFFYSEFVGWMVTLTTPETASVSLRILLQRLPPPPYTSLMTSEGAIKDVDRVLRYLCYHVIRPSLQIRMYPYYYLFRIGDIPI